MSEQFKVTFLDSGREPVCPPNPAYPKGIDINLCHEAGPSCTAALPYPAPRCGVMVVECSTCGVRNAATVAGRVDDPRSITMPCRIAGQA